MSLGVCKRDIFVCFVMFAVSVVCTFFWVCEVCEVIFDDA